MLVYSQLNKAENTYNDLVTYFITALKIGVVRLILMINEGLFKITASRRVTTTLVKYCSDSEGIIVSPSASDQRLLCCVPDCSTPSQVSRGVRCRT